MCLELLFNGLTAIGTLVATGFAIRIAYTDRKELEMIRLSGLSIRIEDDAVAYLENKTDINLKMSIYRNNSIIDERIKDINYKDKINPSIFQNLKYELLSKDIFLSSGETLPIHLKGLRAEEVYVCLVALKIEFRAETDSKISKTKYYLIRFAGEQAKKDEDKIFSDKLNPFNKWIIVLGKSEKRT